MPTRLQLTSGDETWSAEVVNDRVTLGDGGGALTVTPEGARFVTSGQDGAYTGAAALSGEAVWVTIDGEAFEFRVSHGAARARASTREHDAFTPPMSATVVRIAVTPGDHVRDGDVLIALEAMKMELAIRAPRDGVVSAVHCQEGDLVQPGDVLVDLD